MKEFFKKKMEEAYPKYSKEEKEEKYLFKIDKTKCYPSLETIVQDLAKIVSRKEKEINEKIKCTGLELEIKTEISEPEFNSKGELHISSKAEYHLKEKE